MQPGARTGRSLELGELRRRQRGTRALSAGDIFSLQGGRSTTTKDVQLFAKQKLRFCHTPTDTSRVLHWSRKFHSISPPQKALHCWGVSHPALRSTRRVSSFSSSFWIPACWGFSLEWSKMEPLSAYPVKSSGPRAKVFAVLLSMLLCTVMLFLLQLKFLKPKTNSFYTFEVKDAKGRTVSLEKFKGKVSCIFRFFFLMFCCLGPVPCVSHGYKLEFSL